MRIGCWAAIGLLLLSGCDDGDGPGPAQTADAQVITDGGADAAPLDAAPPADMAPDVGPDMAPVQCADGPDPECGAFERQVGCRCESVFDRRCETDLDCRPGETCRES